MDTRSEFGPFKEKLLTLALFQADGGEANEDEASPSTIMALGRIVINLADFTGIDQTESRGFRIACNQAITSVVGDPVLAVTIR